MAYSIYVDILTFWRMHTKPILSNSFTFKLTAQIRNFKFPTANHNRFLELYLRLYRAFSLINVCKLTEDVVKTPKRDGTILIFILYYLYVHLFV